MKNKFQKKNDYIVLKIPLASLGDHFALAPGGRPAARVPRKNAHINDDGDDEAPDLLNDDDLDDDDLDDDDLDDDDLDDDNDLDDDDIDLDDDDIDVLDDLDDLDDDLD